jgi:nucleoside-diphosphate-sugar epimerase
MNLARDEETTIGALAEKIVAIVGRSVRIEAEAVRLRPEASEVQRLRGDSSLARQLLGWTPAVSLDEGLRRTVTWLRENLDAYVGDGYRV